MKNIITLKIDGKPTAKKRVRFSRTGTYNSQKDLMDRTKLLIKNQLPKSFKLIEKDVPVTVNISFFFEPAKGQKTKKFLDIIRGDCYPYCKKADRDNLDKFVLDCCNKIIWNDDAQVYHGSLSKFYSLNPRTEIEIKY